jgi:hypothetical protein
MKNLPSGPKRTQYLGGTRNRLRARTSSAAGDEWQPTSTYPRSTHAQDRGQHCETAGAIRSPSDVGSAMITKASLLSDARDDPAQEMTRAAPPIFDPDQGNHKLSFVAFCEITRRGQAHDAPSRCSHSNNCPGPQHSNRGHR